MSKVYTAASMSLDGFIADSSGGGFEHLFRWHGNGDVEVATAQPDRKLRLSAASAAHLREQLDNTGALVVGRRLFDMTGGWGGNHPFGVPVVVVTHRAPEGWPREGAPFTFVTDGIESAIAQARGIAGDRWVGVSGGSIARQCLDVGLLDEIQVELVPVLFGGGVSFFGALKGAPVELVGPTVVEDTDVTHLKFQVRRD
ncbi:dihydrofolate reductase family protein [Plantactinospora solaniradicis]|uniref:Dihydrofolate reductase family protein n=1 Tax=Plantactinospora solaniradicis TaxID=1723736 RepID=A0ABW1KFS4_9ACTN